MLNKAERFEVLRMIRFWCKLGSLPVEVNLSTWEILPPTKRQTSWKCLFWFFLFVMNAIYKLVTLAYWLKVGMPLYQVVVHAMLVASVSVLSYWYIFLYIKYPRLFGLYVKMTLVGNIDGYEAAVSSQNVRSWSRRLKECTLQDILAMSISYMVLVASLGVVLTFISNPSTKCLLFAALPESCQTWIVFCVLLFEELRLLIVICSIGVPVLIVQVICFDLVRIKLQLLFDFMQRAAGVKRCLYVYKSLRLMQLYVGITNLINCNLIFSCKLLLLGVSIGTGYAAIAHFDAYPIFGVMYYAIMLNDVIVYVLCYDKAFKIPEEFKTVTQRAVLVTHGENAEALKIFKRQMRSFPRIGIKVGQFHLMERESTLIFVHFVLNNIVTMLVALRGS